MSSDGQGDIWHDQATLHRQPRWQHSGLLTATSFGLRMSQCRVSVTKGTSKPLAASSQDQVLSLCRKQLFHSVDWFKVFLFFWPHFYIGDGIIYLKVKKHRMNFCMINLKSVIFWKVFDCYVKYTPSPEYNPRVWLLLLVLISCQISFANEHPLRGFSF